MSMSFVFKQISDLKEQLKNLTIDIKKTVNKNEKLTAEYNEGNEEYKKNKMNLERQVDALVYKLDKLNLAIDDMERRVTGEKDELYQVDMNIKMDTLELKEIKADVAKTRNNFQITEKKLKESIESERKKLKREKELSAEADEKFEMDMQRQKDFFEEKLKSLRKSRAESNEKLERRFKAKEDPLQNRIKFLDAKIRDLENEIKRKTEELKHLNERHEVLRKKLRVSLCDVGQ